MTRCYQENAGARVPQVFDYSDAQVVAMKAPRSGRIGHNTRVVVWDDTGGISFVLYATPIVTYYPDGEIELNSGGHHTVTTKARMNALLPPRFRIEQSKYEWWVRDTLTNKKIPFEDGMRVINRPGWTPKRDEGWSENPSPRAQRFISRKIRTLRHEGYPDGHGQAGAAAYSMARRRGFRIPRQNPEHEGERYGSPDDAYPHPGKFEGESWLAVEMYESEPDETLGDVADFGWYGLYLDFEASDGTRRHGILEERGDGFVSLTEYTKAKLVLDAWRDLTQDYETFEAEQGEPDA